MKFQLAVLVSSAVAAASYAPLSALAAECSAAQQAAANVLVDGEFETACADVFNADPSGDAALDPASLLSANASSLAVLAPCKQPTCAAFLKKQADKVPDCEVSGVNARVVYKTIVDFCSNATAPKSASEKKTAGSGSGSAATVKRAGSGSDSEDSIVTVPSPAKTSSTPATSAPADTVGDKDQDKVNNANTKSDASSSAYAGATAIVAGALLTVLCM